jgi:hypothetical protein
VLKQFRPWLRHRIPRGHTLFVICFTANRNLLSQWRSYTQPGKGVSVGFSISALDACATRQQFKLARCVYDLPPKFSLAERIVKAVVTLAEARGENTDTSKRPADQSFFGVFEEEQEWRAVSDVIKNHVKTPLLYREGVSMLIPYMNFSLRIDEIKPTDLYQVIVGPTPHPNESVNSVSNYLTKQNAAPRRGVAEYPTELGRRWELVSAARRWHSRGIGGDCVCDSVPTAHPCLWHTDAHVNLLSRPDASAVFSTTKLVR